MPRKIKKLEEEETLKPEVDSVEPEVASTKPEVASTNLKLIQNPKLLV